MHMECMNVHIAHTISSLMCASRRERMFVTADCKDARIVAQADLNPHLWPARAPRHADCAHVYLAIYNKLSVVIIGRSPSHWAHFAMQVLAPSTGGECTTSKIRRQHHMHWAALKSIPSLA